MCRRIAASFLCILAVFLAPLLVDAATLSVIPSVTRVQSGDIVRVSVVVNSGGDAINNAEGVLHYPADYLQAVSLSTSGSIFSLWVEQPSFSNASGEIHFNGGAPNPGFTGSSGTIVTVVFNAKRQGTASLSLTDAAVRANDGFGTDVLTNSVDGTVNISELKALASSSEQPQPSAPQPAQAELLSASGAVAIRSDTHPDQARWYKNNSPSFSWDLPADAIEVRTAISENPKATPSVKYNPPISSKTVENLSDGTYYFFLQVYTRDGWGAVSRYQINIDTAPPSAFRITFPHGSVGFDPQPIILFNTSDADSGIDHYDVKVGASGPFSTAAPAGSNPYTLPLQEPGAHKVAVTAFDRAGNTTSAEAEFTVEGIEPPTITSYPDTMPIGDILKIRGTTYPNATVDIVVSQDGTPVTTESVKSNSLGDFSMVISKRLWAGMYSFTARVTDDRGARSPETQPRTVKVQLQFFADALTFILNYFVATLAFLLAIAAIIGVGLWCWYRLVRFARVLRHESSEAETEIHRAFHILRDGVAKHIRALHRAQADRTLTGEELAFLEELEETLVDAEHSILREVHDLAVRARQHGKK